MIAKLFTFLARCWRADEYGRPEPERKPSPEANVAGDPIAWLVRDVMYRDQVFLDLKQAKNRAKERDMNSDIIPLIVQTPPQTNGKPCAFTWKHLNEGEEHRQYGRHHPGLASDSGYVVKALFEQAPAPQDHEPVGWWYQDSTGCIHMSMDVDLGYRHQRETGHALNLLYGKPLPDEPFAPPPENHEKPFGFLVRAGKSKRWQFSTGRGFMDHNGWEVMPIFASAPSPQTNTTAYAPLDLVQLDCEIDTLHEEACKGGIAVINRHQLELIKNLLDAIQPPTGLSEWSGWDDRNPPWSPAKHQDAVCRAAFGDTWSMEDAAALIGFIERTWPRPATTEVQNNG